MTNSYTYRMRTGRMIGVGVLRKIGMTLVVVLLGYLAFHLIATRSNKHHWDGVCMDGLINLQRSWIRDGQPGEYDVARYYQSPSPIVRFYADTNQYVVNGQSVNGLFAAEYAWEDESVVFLVIRDGTLFQRRGKQSLRRLDQR